MKTVYILGAIGGLILCGLNIFLNDFTDFVLSIFLTAAFVCYFLASTKSNKRLMIVGQICLFIWAVASLVRGF